MTDQEILQLISISGLPDGIKTHCELQLEQKIASSFWHALRGNPHRTIAAIGKLLMAVGGILDKTPTQLLEAADFHPQDTNPGRLESALAEFRGIGFLDTQGFSELHLLKHADGTKRADIVGRKNGFLYSFDVWCSSSLCERTLDPIIVLDKPDQPRNSDTKLDHLLVAKYQEKMSQLQATCTQFNCKRHGLIFVVNSPDVVRFYKQDDYLECLKNVYAELNRPETWHFSIVTGTQGGDAVFPEWPISNNMLLTKRTLQVKI